MKLQSVAWVLLAVLVGLVVGGWALRAFLHTLHFLTALVVRVAIVALAVALVVHLMGRRG